MKIFFSHSSREKPLIREIISYLPESVTIWLDERSMNIGESVPDTLKNAIQNESNIIILVVSQEAVISKWVLKELKWALDKEKEIGHNIIFPIVIDKQAWEQIQIPNFKERKYLALIDFEKESIKSLSQKLERAIFDWMVNSLQNPPKIPERLNEPNISGTLKYGNLNSIQKFTGSPNAPDKVILVTLTDEVQKKNKMNLGQPCIILELLNSGADVEIETVNLIFGDTTESIGVFKDANAIVLNSLEYENKPPMGKFLLKNNHKKEISITGEVIFEQIIHRGIKEIEIIDVLGNRYNLSKDEIINANNYFKKYFEIDGLNTLYK